MLSTGDFKWFSTIKLSIACIFKRSLNNLPQTHTQLKQHSFPQTLTLAPKNSQNYKHKNNNNTRTPGKYTRNTKMSSIIMTKISKSKTHNGSTPPTQQNSQKMHTVIVKRNDRRKTCTGFHFRRVLGSTFSLWMKSTATQLGWDPQPSHHGL